MAQLAAARARSRKVADFSDKIMLKINSDRAILPSTANESEQAMSRSASGCGADVRGDGGGARAHPRTALFGHLVGADEQRRREV
jgi:hypothetical protein